MKKIYIQPTTKVVEIKVQASLLIDSVETQGLGSNPLTGGNEEGNAEDEGV
jgi:hypothetical protein